MSQKGRIRRALLFKGVPVLSITLGGALMYVGNLVFGVGAIVLGAAMAVTGLTVFRGRNKQVKFNSRDSAREGRAPQEICPNCRFQIKDYDADSCPKCGHIRRQTSSLKA